MLTEPQHLLWKRALAAAGAALEASAAAQTMPAETIAVHRRTLNAELAWLATQPVAAPRPAAPHTAAVVSRPSPVDAAPRRRPARAPAQAGVTGLIMQTERTS